MVETLFKRRRSTFLRRYTGRFLGVDVGASALKIARLIERQGQLFISEARCIPFPEPLSPQRPDDALAHITDALQQAMPEAVRWLPTPAACLLPSSLIQLRALDAPDDFDGDLGDYLRGELSGEMNTPPEQLAIDYWETSSPSADKLSCGLAGAPLAFVEGVASAFAQAGAECRIVDGAPFALARAAAIHSRATAPGVQAVLDWGYETPLFVLVDHHKPVFFRFLRGCGLRQLIESIQSGLQLQPPQALDFLHVCHLAARSPADQPSRLLATLADLAAPLARKLFDELARTLDFTRRQPALGKLSRLLVTGGGGLLPHLATTLKALDVEIESWVPRVGHQNAVDLAAAPLYAGAISMALLEGAA